MPLHARCLQPLGKLSRLRSLPVAVLFPAQGLRLARLPLPGQRQPS